MWLRAATIEGKRAIKTWVRVFFIFLNFFAAYMFSGQNSLLKSKDGLSESKLDRLESDSEALADSSEPLTHKVMAPTRYNFAAKRNHSEESTHDSEKSNYKGFALFGLVKSLILIWFYCF